MKNYSIAILLPCFNEETTIAGVVSHFRKIMPEATIYVYDNNSTDRTAHEAGEAGAIVRKEVLQGKGNVVRRMFADIEADVYVLADGDETYDVASAPKLVSTLIRNKLVPGRAMRRRFDNISVKLSLLFVRSRGSA